MAEKNAPQHYETIEYHVGQTALPGNQVELKFARMGITALDKKAKFIGSVTVEHGKAPKYVGIPKREAQVIKSFLSCVPEHDRTPRPIDSTEQES